MKKQRKNIKARSGFEARVLKDLDKREIAYGYETCVLIYTLPTIVHKYTPDIYLPHKNKTFIELKGRFTSKDRTKLKAVVAQNPGVQIKLLFQRDNKLNPLSARRYSDWARRNGFTFAVGDKVPQEWLT